MSVYFKYFPKIRYDDQEIRDITRRVSVYDRLQRNPYVYLSYTVKEDDRPEDIAFFYYGDVKYTWLVLLANNIIDPYTQWPMQESVWIKYMTKKYQDNRDLAVENDGFSGSVIEWTKRESEGVVDNIVYYENIDDDSIRISKDSHIRDDWNSVSAQWRPIRVFEHEQVINDSRRQISLISKDYKNLALSDLKKLLRD